MIINKIDYRQLRIHNIMENNENSSRIIYADIIRILSTFAVIVLHVASSKWYETPVNEYSWQIFNIYDSLTRFCVPLFVMLSGMFFLNPDKDISISEIYKKYILRLLLAIYFWGIFYQATNILIKYYLDKEIINVEIIKISIGKIILGPPWYHLWYLYMLIGLYILTPIYRIISKYATKENLLYFISIFFIFGTCLNLVNKLLSFIDSRCKIFLSIDSLVDYTGYFFIGYYLSKYDLKKMTRYIIYSLAGGGDSNNYTNNIIYFMQR